MTAYTSTELERLREISNNIDENGSKFMNGCAYDEATEFAKMVSTMYSNTFSIVYNGEFVELKRKNSEMVRGFMFVSGDIFKEDITNCGLDNKEVERKLPKRATKKSAGYDCYSPIEFELNPGEEIKIPTGIRSYMKDGEVLLAFPRSGLGFKYYCRLANTVGVIDSDYFYSENEGHIMVKIRNEGDKKMTIKKGEAICQFVFMPFLLADGDDFENGETRNGGFGSTSKNE